ncbi:hypothetical protein CkaCkLH20_03070 [Colletotrichum karsti]|uniref:Uncharacterized protein n=1 Tax=Colletotrichum karsti TaxID=1095194 RepID=A0A9P6LPD9_9PEZI|nr:uncharacterized protein CkaCkLH20_03070 [Colletotrichum karsti]KAF9879527.1 hypothetical protein CkaCkLH20_03070 [Colletotrichum karsti]
MPGLEDITYSREETTAAISGYYEFLIRMYLKDSQVVRPPAGGWPSIVNADPEVVQSLGKTDEVLALLAHLPYIRSPGNWNDDAEAAPGCRFAEWPRLLTTLSSSNAITGEDMRAATEGFTFARLAPPHVVGLTRGDRENPIMVLDTKLGIIHWEDCISSIERAHYGESVDYEPDDDVPEEEANWRYSARAWAIPDFFEILKQQFRTLDWIPISHHTVLSASDSEGTDEGGMVAMVQDIYREHGWPDLTVYRKAACLEAVRIAMAERYPNSACGRG